MIGVWLSVGSQWLLRKDPTLYWRFISSHWVLKRDPVLVCGSGGSGLCKDA